jgi:plastocyanin
MNRRSIYITIGIIAALLLGAGIYFTINGNNMFMTNNNSDVKINTKPGTVNIQNFAFSPSTIKINKGDTVTWANSDSTIHRIVADDSSFDLGDQSSGATVKHTFKESGTFNYHCAIHTSMKGVIVVK